MHLATKISSIAVWEVFFPHLPFLSSPLLEFLTSYYTARLSGLLCTGCVAQKNIFYDLRGPPKVPKYFTSHRLKVAWSEALRWDHGNLYCWPWLAIFIFNLTRSFRFFIRSCVHKSSPELSKIVSLFKAASSNITEASFELLCLVSLYTSNFLSFGFHSTFCQSQRTCLAIKTKHPASYGAVFWIMWLPFKVLILQSHGPTNKIGSGTVFSSNFKANCLGTNPFKRTISPEYPNIPHSSKTMWKSK